jgi:hypothetical protein
MDLGELLNGHQDESPTLDCRHEYSSHQEDELLALVLEKSKTDIGRAPRNPCPVSPMRKKRIPLEVVNETQCWTARECRKTRPTGFSEERVEPRRNASGGSVGVATGPSAKEHRLVEEERRHREEERRKCEEERRLIEEEQENEMILLAMERSLADAAEQQRRHGQVKRDPFLRAPSPHRVPYYQSEVPAVNLQGDENEVARREQELIQRAMEMSMQDF